jgi:ribosomal RNA methyltransferase Nop2
MKNRKCAADLELLTKNQKELIIHAFDSVKPSGGNLVYCTCSVLIEENEAVVDYLLKNRDAARVVPPNIDKEFDGELQTGIYRYEGLIMHPSIKNTRRVYPHRLNMDGFFFAVIKVLPHKVDGAQRPVGLPQPKPDLRQKKTRKFSKRFGGK